MTILFTTLQSNYLSSNPSSPRFASQVKLFEEIGWDEFLKNPNYTNTCAIRVSLAMVRSGLKVNNGSHRILKGPSTGQRIEVSMKKLASSIEQSSQFSKAERYTTNIYPKVKDRSGIIAFFTIPGYSGGGHIDLLNGNFPDMRCESACYSSQEVWFWPMK